MTTKLQSSHTTAGNGRREPERLQRREPTTPLEQLVGQVAALSDRIDALSDALLRMANRDARRDACHMRAAGQADTDQAAPIDALTAAAAPSGTDERQRAALLVELTLSCGPFRDPHVRTGQAIMLMMRDHLRSAKDSAFVDGLDDDSTACAMIADVTEAARDLGVATLERAVEVLNPDNSWPEAVLRPPWGLNCCWSDS